MTEANASQAYIIDEEDRIIPKYSVGWAREVPEDREFDECLEYLKDMLFRHFEDSEENVNYVRSEEFLVEVNRSYYLDILEGLRLVTGTFLEDATFRFEWRGRVYFTIRPDFIRNTIISDFSEFPINKLEGYVRNALLEYPEIDSIERAIRYGEIDPNALYNIQWWKNFWSVRGVEIIAGKPESPPPDDQGTILALPLPTEPGSGPVSLITASDIGHAPLLIDDDLGRAAKGVLDLATDISREHPELSKRLIIDRISADSRCPPRYLGKFDSIYSIVMGTNKPARKRGLRGMKKNE